MKNTSKELTDQQQRSIDLKIASVGVKLFAGLKNTEVGNIPDELDSLLKSTLEPLFRKELFEKEALIQKIVNLEEQLQLTKECK